MPYEGLGVRHTAIATKACVHGQIVVEDGFVGTAFKVSQIDRWTRPADAGRIAIGEEFEIQVGGVHETAAAGGVAAGDIARQVHITVADNRLVLARAAGTLPVGLVTELDTSRAPDVLRINSNAWQAFLPGA